MDILLDSCDFIPEQGVSAHLAGGGVENLSLTRATLGEAAARRGEPSDRISRRKCWWRGDQASGGEDEEMEGGVPSAECRMTAVERFDGRVLLCPEESYQLMYAVRAEGIGGFDAAGKAGTDGERSFGEGRHTLGQVGLH